MADATARFDAPLSAGARQFKEDAARHIDALCAARHADGFSYPMVDEKGRVTQVHPDGTAVALTRFGTAPITRAMPTARPTARITATAR